MTTITSPENIIADMPKRPIIDPDDPTFDDGSIDWNWAYAATDAWLAEAKAAGLHVEEIDFDERRWELDFGGDAGLVEVLDDAWVIYIEPRTETLRVRLAERKDAE